MYKTYVLAGLLTMLLGALSGHGQQSSGFHNRQIDSLKRLINSDIPDTQKVINMNMLAKMLLQTDAGQARRHTLEAIRLADKIGFTTGKAKANTIMGRYYSQYQNDYWEATIYYHKALELYKTLDLPEQQVIPMVLLGACYERLGDNEQTKTLYETAMKKYEKLRNYTAVAGLLNNLGGTARRKGAHQLAMDYYNRSLDLCDSLEDMAGKSRALANIGWVYIDQGNHGKAGEVLLASMELAEQQELHLQYSRAVSSMGHLYIIMGEMDKSLESFERSLAINRQYGDRSGIGEALSQLGLFYLHDEQFDLALTYLYEALDTLAITGDKVTFTLIHANIGATYTEKGDYKKALDHYHHALDLAAEIDFKDNYITIIGMLGRNYLALGQYRLAEKYLLQGIDLSREVGAMTRMRDCYQLLSQTYRLMDQYEKAYHNLSQYTIINDSIVGIEKSKALVAMEAKYEHHKNLRRIDSLNTHTALLDQKNRIQELEINQGNLWRWSLSAVVIIVLLALILLYLVSRKNKIHDRAKNLLLQQKLLRTQMNPHFIFNFLTCIQGIIYKREPRAAADYIADFAHLVRMYLENSRHEYIDLERELSGLKYYLRLKQELLNINFMYRIHIDPELNTAEIAIPPMLAQPFIENALEHGIGKMAGKGEIEIWFKREEGQLRFEITDNGIGIGQSKAGKAGDPAHRSLAIEITEERLSLLNRNKKQKIKLEIEDLSHSTDTLSGTRVSFRIPYRAAS